MELRAGQQRCLGAARTGAVRLCFGAAAGGRVRTDDDVSRPPQLMDGPSASHRGFVQPSRFGECPVKSTPVRRATRSE